MFTSQIHIGPLTLSVFSVVLLLSALISSLILLPRYRKTPSGKFFFDKLTTSIIIAFAGWKIFPLFVSPGYITSPISLLYIPGGTYGAVFGIAASAGYLLIVFTYKNSLKKELLGLMAKFSTAFIISNFLLSAAAYSITSNSYAESAPEFTALSMDNKPVSLSSYSGRTVILNFWATWCPPCRAEIPELVNFAEDIPEDKAVLIGINASATEKSRESVRKFVLENGINYQILNDADGSVAGLYGIKTLPTTVVISGSGDITARHTGAVNRSWLESQLPRKGELFK